VGRARKYPRPTRSCPMCYVLESRGPEARVEDYIGRRDFFTFLGGAAMWPLSARR
jgi:hypothetical protein